MPRPAGRPIGLELASTAKAVTRAFDDALAASGGSQPVWLVLMTLKRIPTATQRELADSIGIRGATLTHHLDGMESDGLIRRRRDPENRRAHIVELTPEGEAAFTTLRKAAMGFDAKLRSGLSETELDQLRGALGRLRDSVG